MAQYFIVAKRNKHAKIGTWFELTDDGLEQVLLSRTESGKVEPRGYTGLIIPQNTLSDCLVRIQNKGFDDALYLPKH